MRHILILFVFSIFFSSCKLFRSNLMLKTPEDFVYDECIDSLKNIDYKVSLNDVIQYRIIVNKGEKLVDFSTSSNLLNYQLLDVVVDAEGFINMPLAGKIYVAGLNLKELEKLLIEKFSQFLVDPFITVKVINRRVIIFPGNGAMAKVLPLANNNTTIIEAIASSGGILEDGKAYKVKLIRSNEDLSKKPIVYLIDLSTINGLKSANIKVQANDIIYVEPRYRPLLTFNKEITPIITLLSTLLLLYQFSK